MGNCVSAPKDSEKAHHVKGKPTTSHVVAVSLDFMKLELVFIDHAVS